MLGVRGARRVLARAACLNGALFLLPRGLLLEAGGLARPFSVVALALSMSQLELLLSQGFERAVVSVFAAKVLASARKVVLGLVILGAVLLDMLKKQGWRFLRRGRAT